MTHKTLYKTALAKLRKRLQDGDDIAQVASASAELLAQSEPHEPDIPEPLARRLLERL